MASESKTGGADVEVADACIGCGVVGKSEPNRTVCRQYDIDYTRASYTRQRADCKGCKGGARCAECAARVCTMHMDQHLEWDHGWSPCEFATDDGGRCGTAIKLPADVGEPRCALHPVVSI